MKQAITIGLMASLCSLALTADEEAERPWTNKTEFSAVWTGGNSESSTIGLKNDYVRSFENAKLTFKLGAIRAESSTFSRVAVGTPEQYEVSETETTDLTAENYLADLKYNKNITETFYWYLGTDWKRDEFAGIKNRLGLGGGLGNQIIDNDKTKFDISYGLKYVIEDPIVEPTDYDDQYGAMELAFNHSHKLTATAEYSQSFKATANLEETDDFIADWDHGVSAAISKKMQLKIGLKLLYDNQPAFSSVPLTGTNQSVLYELDEIDTQFTASLVINI